MKEIPTLLEPGSASFEYVPDWVDLSSYGSTVISRTDVAVAGVIDYLSRRVQALAEKWDERPILMLSGGVDSLLLAAAMVRQGLNPLAVTFTAIVGDWVDEEAQRASALCSVFDLEHELVSPSPTEFAVAAEQNARVLGVSDPWEVVAAVVLSKCEQRADSLGLRGPIFTGGGADSVFLGGETFEEGKPSSVEWSKAVRDRVSKNFTRHRLIPDFYERLLAQPDRHIQCWQTLSAVDFGLSLQPTAVRGDDLATDKLVLREAAVELGVPRELVFHAKNPMQVSSGGVAALVGSARAWLSTRRGSAEYADPFTEPLEYTVARLWLERAFGLD